MVLSWWGPWRMRYRLEHREQRAVDLLCCFVQSFWAELWVCAADVLLLARKQDDQRLPAVTHLLSLLRRGVAMHHSGMLPVLRELVELLFQQGLIKLLFATGAGNNIAILSWLQHSKDPRALGYGLPFTQ